MVTEAEGAGVASAEDSFPLDVSEGDGAPWLNTLSGTHKPANTNTMGRNTLSQRGDFMAEVLSSSVKDD